MCRCQHDWTAFNLSNGNWVTICLEEHQSSLAERCCFEDESVNDWRLKHWIDNPLC